MPSSALPDWIARGDGSPRRRRIIVSVLVVALIVVGAPALGFGAIYWTLSSQPTEQLPPTATPPPLPPGMPTLPDGAEPLPWQAALVARDGTTITLFTGVEDCHRAVAPQAAVTDEDASQVTIALFAQVIEVSDCSRADESVAASLSLPAPLERRTLTDASSTRSPIVYFEQYLPELDPSWSPDRAHWSPSGGMWIQRYHGPDNLELELLASRGPGFPQGTTVGPVQLGPHEGTIRESAVGWIVRWKVGVVNYTLWITPPEGSPITLEEFEQHLSQLRWAETPT